MAFMSQTQKAQIAPVVKAICKKYGVKASLSVVHHSTLALTIQSGPIDFGGTGEVNHYFINEHYEGVARDFLNEVNAAMNEGNFDKSDPMTDYFCVGWYVRIRIGRWDKPYELKA